MVTSLRALAAIGVLLCASGTAQPARAQPPIEDNDFRLDWVTTPVLGSSRVLGLGGAFSALSYGIDGAAQNPAAYGTRTLYERETFEWGATLGGLLPGTFADIDFFNDDGRLAVDDAGFGEAGLRFQYGLLGFGALYRHQTFQVGETTTQLWDLSFGFAYGLMDGQLVLGIGGNLAGMDLGAGESEVLFLGVGAEAGAVLQLADRPWRIGASIKSPIVAEPDADSETTNMMGVRSAGGLVLPEEVWVPWEARIGFALQVGERPLNARWERPRDPGEPMMSNVRRLWCERERAQLARELPEGQTLPTDARCPDELPGRPQNASWRERERARRRWDKHATHERIDAAEDAASARRQRAYEALPRHYWLLTAELVLTGATPAGVSIDGFIAQERRRSGKNVSVSVHAGVETEPIADWLKIRWGGYVEPPRIEDGDWRPHLTLGFDARTFTWDLFGAMDDFTVALGLVGDVAPVELDYYTVGLNISFWH